MSVIYRNPQSGLTVQDTGDSFIVYDPYILKENIHVMKRQVYPRYMSESFIIESDKNGDIFLYDRTRGSKGSKVYIGHVAPPAQSMRQTTMYPISSSSRTSPYF